MVSISLLARKRTRRFVRCDSESGGGGDLVVAEVELLQICEVRERIGNGGDLVVGEEEDLQIREVR